MAEYNIRLTWVCRKCAAIWDTETTHKQWMGDNEVEAICPDCGAEHERNTAEVEIAGFVKKENITQSSGSVIWLSPQAVWGPAEQLMSGIDLDPCSETTPEGRSYNIPALVHWTVEDDSLTREWHIELPGNMGAIPSRVFMNPPYNKSNVQAKFVDKLLAEYEAKRVRQAVILIASRTDTAWYRELREFPRCNVWGRLKFLKPTTDGSTEIGPATFPSAIFGLGIDVGDFDRAYNEIGDVYVCVKDYRLRGQLPF